MEQMMVPKQMEVEIDFERPGVPYRANVLHPVLFVDGDNYCCVLGPDSQAGIFGCGSTPEQALQDWDKNLSERLERAIPGDDLVSFVKENLDKQMAMDKTADSSGFIRITKKGSPLSSGVFGYSQEAEIKIEVKHVRKNTTDQSNADGSEFR